MQKVSSIIPPKQELNKQLRNAVKDGKYNKTKYLIEHGAELNNTDDSLGETVLFLAVRFHHVNIIKLLLKKGADINAKDVDNYTPLHLAIYKNNILKLLLKKGAHVNAATNDGLTALHLAMQSGQQDSVQELIEMGANIAAKDNLGDTALQLAQKKQYDELVKTIEKDNLDDTALQLAQKKQYDELVKTIEKAKTQLIKLVKKMPTKIEKTLKSIDKLNNLPSEIIEVIVDNYFNPEQKEQAQKYIKERDAAAAAEAAAAAAHKATLD